MYIKYKFIVLSLNILEKKHNFSIVIFLSIIPGMKVEDACYAIAVRGSEIPDNFVVDLFEKNNDDYGEEH